jgi:hypothetical protein
VPNRERREERESERVGEWESGRVGEWESGRVGEWESGGESARERSFRKKNSQGVCRSLKQI